MKHHKKGAFAAMVKSRVFQSGGLTLLLCALAIAAAAALNMTVGALPAQQTKFDLSAQKLYSLSQKTENLLDGLTQQVTLYQIARPGSESLMVSTLLEKYAGRTSYVTMQVVDPVSNPAFIKQYTDDTVNENSVIVACGDKFKVLDLADMVLTDYDVTTGQQIQEFDGEARITSAISLLAGAERPVLYVLSGHGEYELDSQFLDLLEKENYQVKELNLLSMGGVPGDAAAVLASESSADISAQEREYLQSYLGGGGSLMLLTDYLQSGYPNWEKLAAGYGMSLLPGVAVEQDASRYLSGYPTFILPQLREHAVTKGLMASNQLYLIASAQALTTPGEETENVTVSRLLITSEEACLATETETSDTGAFCLAAAAEKTAAAPSRMVWITSTSMLNSVIDSQVSGANSDFVLNALNWLAGIEEGSTIRPKSLFAEGVLMTASQTNFWSVLLIGAIPVLLIGVGVAVCLVRRRR